jgi:hypothetical protein
LKTFGGGTALSITDDHLIMNRFATQAPGTELYPREDMPGYELSVAGMVFGIISRGKDRDGVRVVPGDCVEQGVAKWNYFQHVQGARGDE